LEPLVIIEWRGKMTIKCGLFVRLEAKPGKEQAVADFSPRALK